MPMKEERAKEEQDPFGARKMDEGSQENFVW